MQDTFNDDTGLEEVAEKGRAPMFISSNLGGKTLEMCFQLVKVLVIDVVTS